MALWPYAPQATLGDTLSADGVIRVGVAPQTEVAGVMTSDLQRTFALRYTLVESADAYGMRAFFTARRGNYEAFDFVNPNDGYSYRVRFGSNMRVEHFWPSWFRAGGDITLLVTSG